MQVEGFCTFERRDELGALPPEVTADLVACEQRGARSALRATLERADVLLIAVPAVAQANANTGIEALRRAARASGVPHWIVDTATDPLRSMVTGPRYTRWREGERVGWRLVAQLSLTPALAARKHRVLVVDDHRDTAETTCNLLRALGHDAIPAMTGTQGLEVAQQFDPDVGFIDIGLPDISGYELARRMRSTQQHPLFLAAITGWDQARDAKLALDAGFDRHVIKPTSADIIRSLIEQAAHHIPQVA